jgi:hypothetical protein
MRAILACSIAAALAAGSVPLAAETPAERGEARLAEMIEGRTAGEGRSCINAINSNRIRIIEHVGIVYEGGDTVWVARTSHPRQLDSFDVPIFERRGSQLCKTDIIRTVDRSSGMFTGSVFLDDFVPYTRPAEG